MNPSEVANPTQPIFLLGFARSGTTWMAIALRDYLDVGMVNEGTFITALGERYAADRPVADVDKLIDRIERHEFCRILKQAYDISIDWRRVRAAAAGATYAALIRAVLADIAQQLGRRLVGSKSPAFGRQIDVLLRHFPDCSIIHVLRDGRDVALSHYQKDWGRKNAYVAAARWQKYIASVRQAVNASAADYLEVRYEDLLRDPSTNFRRVAAFVQAHDRTSTASADDVAARFAASIKPADFDNRAFKWKHYMSAQDAAIFEAAAGQTLAELGYEAAESSAPLPAWHRGYYRLHDRLLREWNHKKKKLSVMAARARGS